MAKSDKQIAPAEAAELNQKDDAAAATGLVGPDEQQSQALANPSDEEIEAQLAYENLKRKRNAKRRKRIIIIVVVVILIIIIGAVVALLGAVGNSGQLLIDSVYQSPVTVRRGEFAATVGASGKTEPISESVVSPEVEGIIENLNAQVGQQVNAGDVLFTLRNDLYDQDVRKKREALDTAIRARDSSNRKVDEAYAARERAWNIANDTGEWLSYDDISLTAAINDAEAAFVTSDAQVVSAEEDLQEAEEKAAKRNVLAPVTGNVVSVNARNGQSVGGAAGGTTNTSNSNLPLIQIADTSTMKVSVQVNEVDIDQIAVGQDATVTFQALPDVTLDSKVQSIATVATSSSSTSSTAGGEASASGVVTYAVVLHINNAEGKIKPGMTANIVITTKKIDDALVVPASVVFGADTGDAHVYKITDAENKKCETVSVEVTDKSATECAVKGKLADGDQLLAQDIESLGEPTGA